MFEYHISLWEGPHSYIRKLLILSFDIQQPLNPATQDVEYGILIWGALGICAGLVFYGEKVIETMGSKICDMTPSMGFAVVLTASILVMFASITGLPASTTHCQVNYF